MPGTRRRRERRNDRPPDPLVGRQPLPGPARYRDADGLGPVGAAHDAGRRAARSVRCAGHHPHQLPGPGAADCREPGHLPAGHDHDVGARGQDRARLLFLRRFLCLRAVRGWHRPVLGALAGAGVPEPGAGPAAGHRQGGARARRHGGRLDLSVRAGRPQRQERSFPAARAAGLVPEVRAEKPAGCRRGGLGRRHGQAVPGRARPVEAGGSRHHADGGARGLAARQPGDRRLGAGAGRRRVHGARQRLSEDPGRLPRRAAGPARRRAGAPGRCRHRAARPRDAPGHRRTGRRGRGGRRHRRAALRQERADHDCRGARQAGRAAGQPAQGGGDRHHLRPQCADRASDPQPRLQAGRGVPRRRRGLCALPLASALGLGGHHFAAAGHPGRLPGDALPGHQRQHHVAGRHRDRHRRDGRRRRGDDRERAQEARGLAAQPRRYASDRQRALGGDHAGGRGGWAGLVLFLAHHHPVLHPGVHAGGAGGQAVRAAGVHQDLCDGGGCRALGDPDPGADGLLDPWPHSR